MKPIEPERLEAALERVRARAEPTRDDVARLVSRLSRGGPPRLVARRGEETRWFSLADVTRLRTDSRYVVLRAEGKTYFLEESLTSLERRLGPWGFVRVHRGELVNVAAIRSLVKRNERAHLELVDGRRVPVSRRRLAAVEERLGI